MIQGITPIDTAFDMMGLHQAQALTRFMFIETLAGKVLFGLGFILSLVKGLEKGNFKPVLMFVFLFFSLWFLCVMPHVRVTPPISAMERNGYKDITAADILKKSGYAELVVNPVVYGVSRWMDVLVTGVVAVIDHVGNEGRGYLASPFLRVKVSMITSAIVAQGITDPKLREDAARFYQQDYWGTVRGLGESAQGVWPGDPRVVALYKEEARARWNTLRDALYAFANQDKIFDRTFARFYNGNINKDGVVKALLNSEMKMHSRLYTLFTYASRRGDEKVLGNVTGVMQKASQRLIQFLPLAQGLCLFLGWASFPIFVAAALMFQSFGYLALWMGLILCVKGWSVGWVIVEKSADLWFLLQASWGGVELWRAPVVNDGTAIAAFMVPLAGMGIFFMGFMRMKAGQKG